MTITVSTSDPRSLKALAIAETSGQWLKCHARDGRKAYGVPSQTTPGLFYVVDLGSCTCPDFARLGLLCKHVLAVRLHVARVRAQGRGVSAAV